MYEKAHKAFSLYAVLHPQKGNVENLYKMYVEILNCDILPDFSMQKIKVKQPSFFKHQSVCFKKKKHSYINKSPGNLVLLDIIYKAIWSTRTRCSDMSRFFLAEKGWQGIGILCQERKKTQKHETKTIWTQGLRLLFENQNIQLIITTHT